MSHSASPPVMCPANELNYISCYTIILLSEPQTLNLQEKEKNPKGRAILRRLFQLILYGAPSRSLNAFFLCNSGEHVLPKWWLRP